MTIDVSKLNTQELDQLIAEAMQRRWHMKPGVPAEMPKMAAAVVDPRWFTHLDGENTILQLRHPGAGWVAFAFPPHERVHILSLLLQQALAPKASGQIPVPIAGGGAIH